MTSPGAKADNLIAALHENTRALNTVRNRYKWSFVLTAMLTLVLAFVVYSNHQADVELCENNNEIRADINDKFESIGDFLSRTSPDTPRTQEFAELVRSDIPSRDCSNISWLGP